MATDRPYDPDLPPEAPKPPVLKGVAGRKNQRIAAAAGAPQNLARLVLEHRFTRARHKTIVMFSSDFCVYREGRYIKREPEQIRTIISRFIDSKIDLEDGKKGTVPMTSWHVNETFKALCAQVMLPPEIEPPCWIGTGQAPWDEANRIITLKNGVLDVAGESLFPNTPEWFALDGLDVNYEPEATCPTFMAALAQWLPTDEQARSCLQELYGYLVEGNNDLEKIAVIVGGARSGKGTNGRVLEAMFRSSLVKPLLSSFAGPFGAESLTAASIALFTDARLGKNADTANAIEKMLAISGRDSPGVQRKYKPDFAGTSRARIVMLCNELPHLPDASAALGHRFILIRFLQSFLGTEDPDLARKLVAELSGILNWALEGLQRLRARGAFSLPEDSADVLQDYIDGNNPLADFLFDKCAFHEDYTIGKDSLYAGYVAWAQDKGIKRPLGRSRFYRMLAPTRKVDIFCRCDPATGTTRSEGGVRPPRHVHGLSLRGVYVGHD